MIYFIPLLKLYLERKVGSMIRMPEPWHYPRVQGSASLHDYGGIRMHDTNNRYILRLAIVHHT